MKTTADTWTSHTCLVVALLLSDYDSEATKNARKENNSSGNSIDSSLTTSSSSEEKTEEKTKQYTHDYITRTLTAFFTKAGYDTFTLIENADEITPQQF